MSLYIVNCDKLKFFKTFKSLDSAISFLDEKNKADFDGKTLSLFGRGMKEVFDNSDESEWVDSDYLIDSVVLVSKEKPFEYFPFFIRRIDSEGNIIDLVDRSNK